MLATVGRYTSRHHRCTRYAVVVSVCLGFLGQFMFVGEECLTRPFRHRAFGATLAAKAAPAFCFVTSSCSLLVINSRTHENSVSVTFPEAHDTSDGIGLAVPRLRVWSGLAVIFLHCLLIGVFAPGIAVKALTFIPGGSTQRESPAVELLAVVVCFHSLAKLSMIRALTVCSRHKAPCDGFRSFCKGRQSVRHGGPPCGICHKTIEMRGVALELILLMCSSKSRERREKSVKSDG